MQLKQLVSYLDAYFSWAPFTFDRSQNGLQVEGNLEVSSITSAVDACMPAFKETARQSAQFLITHHGLFWGNSLLITGLHRDRIAWLLKKGISLYAMHLPLDAHRDVGNNAQLAKILHLYVVKPFGNCHSMSIGVEATSDNPIKLSEFVVRVEEALHTQVHLLKFGKAEIQRIAIVSGAAAYEIPLAARQGFDLLLTGEVDHNYYHQAQEYGLNVIYAGHYATETLGVKALGEHLSQKFGLPHTFLDFPTGF